MVAAMDASLTASGKGKTPSETSNVVACPAVLLDDTWVCLKASALNW